LTKKAARRAKINLFLKGFDAFMPGCSRGNGCLRENCLVSAQSRVNLFQVLRAFKCMQGLGGEKVAYGEKSHLCHFLA